MWLKLFKPKYVIILVLLISAVIGFNYVKDLRSTNKTLLAEKSTLSEQFTKISNAYKEQGVLYATEKQAWTDATAALGSDFTQRLKDSDARIRVLHELVATLDEDIRHGTVVVQPTGSGFTQTLRQERSSGPALTEVSLAYDKDSQKLAYTWDNFKEVYSFTLGEWVKKDGGYVSGARVRRSVYKNNSELIGSEEVPLVSAEARYNPEVPPGPAPVVIPRWMLFGGPGWDMSKHKVVPTFGVDYRVTNSFGVSTGIAGNVVFTNLSWRLGN